MNLNHESSNPQFTWPIASSFWLSKRPHRSHVIFYHGLISCIQQHFMSLFTCSLVFPNSSLLHPLTPHILNSIPTNTHTWSRPPRWKSMWTSSFVLFIISGYLMVRLSTSDSDKREAGFKEVEKDKAFFCTVLLRLFLFLLFVVFVCLCFILYPPWLEVNHGQTSGPNLLKAFNKRSVLEK